MALARPIFAIFMLLLSLMVIVSASGGNGYGPNSAPEKSEREEKEKYSSTTIAIQGLIYCQSGSELTPLEGAVARITCVSVDKHGYEITPFSILSGATDDKGYYFTTLSPSELKHNWRLKQCKAFLELSPSNTCSVPTNMNNGTTGYRLSDHRLLRNKKMILFSVPPFSFTSEYNTTTKGY